MTTLTKPQQGRVAHALLEAGDAPTWNAAMKQIAAGEHDEHPARGSTRGAAPKAPGATRRIKVQLGADLLAQVDAEVPEGQSRSEWIAEAIRRRLVE